MSSFASARRPLAFEPSVTRNDEVGFSRELWSEMAELGWLGLQIPEDYDGLGLGFFDLCVVLEQSGRELMPEPFVSTLLLGTQALLLGGTEAQRRRCFLASRRARSWRLATRKPARRRFASKRSTVARKSADGFELQRRENPGARRSSWRIAIIVSAATSGPAADTLRSSLVGNPKQPGVTITRQHRIDGLNAAIVRARRRARRNATRSSASSTAGARS